MHDKNSPNEQPIVATGNFQVNAQLANGQTIVFSQYTYNVDTEKDINDRLDIVNNVIARQRAISEIPVIEANISTMEQTRDQFSQILDSLENRKMEGGKLNSQEHEQLRALPQNIVHAGREIEKGKQSLLALKNKAGLTNESAGLQNS